MIKWIIIDFYVSLEAQSGMRLYDEIIINEQKPIDVSLLTLKINLVFGVMKSKINHEIAKTGL